MKFAILSGAYKNAGDFLIVDRTKKLIADIYPDAELVTYMRNKPLEEHLPEINSCDRLIMAGGPAYMPDAYPSQIPLTENLDDIKIPICGVGMGWYGRFSVEQAVMDYGFSDKTRQLLDRLSRDGILTCRDYYTVRALEKNGYKALMTGCPAWYDIENAEKTTLRDGINIPYKKICISDPGNVTNVNQALVVTEFIKSRYKDAEIHFVFHRGIKADEWTSTEMGESYTWLNDRLQKLGIIVHDISYSPNGFSVYDDCDLHIGFRVHAHIYNLSKRNISVLIEEDGRGAGVNQALGLIPLPAYDVYAAGALYGGGIVNKGLRFIHRRKYGKQNNMLLSTLESILTVLETNDYRIMLSAYSTMTMYYHVMRKYIESFSLSE